MCKDSIIRITWLFCSVLFWLLQSSTVYSQKDLQASLSPVVETKSSSPQQVISQLSHQSSTDYVSVICTGELDLSAIPSPQALKAITDVSALLVLENRYDLGCNASDFTGYFDPSRWVDSRIKSAGGVDVTGAPGQLLVEGTNDYPVVVADRRAPRFTVKMPSSGYVTFNWNDLGGSLSNPTALAFFINNQQVDVKKGRLMTFVQAGDELHFELSASFNKPLIIQDFSFLSDLAYLITREWVNDQHQVLAGQYISVEKPNMGDIRFPRNTLVTQSIHPEFTGYPMLDADGDSKTLEDQIVLAGTFNGVQVSYSDKIDVEQHRILRTWTINDTCGANVLSQVQELKVAYNNKPQSPKEDNKVKHNSLPKQSDHGGSYSSSFLVFN